MKKKRDDIRRTTRIIQIDEMLRGGAFVGINELVFKFGVNKRTIERDFERLRDDMNAPLEYDKASGKYHYTDPTFCVPNVVLTEGELFTVSTLMPLLEQYKNTPLELSFKNIMSKIALFLPDKVTVDSSFLNTDISFISDPLPEIDAQVFNQIFKAIKNRIVISLEYKSAGSKVFKKKTFDCYHVICQKGNWYVLGFDHDAADFRVFALSRIKSIDFTNEAFTVRQDFDIHRHIDLNFGIWNNPEPPEEYEFIFSANIANYILEREWHKNQIAVQNDDGTVLLKFNSNQKQTVFSWVMSFGDAVTVLKPQRLIEEIREECKKMSKKYE